MRALSPFDCTAFGVAREVGCPHPSGGDHPHRLNTQRFECFASRISTTHPAACASIETCPSTDTKRPCEYRITTRIRPRPSILTLRIHSAPSCFDRRLSTRKTTTSQRFALDLKRSHRHEPAPARHARPRTIPYTAFPTAFGVDFHTSVVTPPPFRFVASASASHRARTRSLTPLRSIAPHRVGFTGHNVTERPLDEGRSDTAGPSRVLPPR